MDEDLEEDTHGGILHGFDPDDVWIGPSDEDIPPEEMEWLEQAAPDFFNMDQDEGMVWTDDTSMGTSDYEDADLMGSYDGVPGDDAAAAGADPLVLAFEQLDKSAPGAPPQGKLFPGQPISHLAIRGAASHLRPGLASFPVASVSQHFQTADSLTIIPPITSPGGSVADSISRRDLGAQREKAPLELLVGDCRNLKVIRFKPWAVEDQLKDHIPRLKGALAYVAYLKEAGLEGGWANSSNLYLRGIVESARRAAADAAKQAASQFQPKPSGVGTSQAGQSDAIGMQVGSVGGDEATSPIDTGCQVVCEAGLHYDHYSMAASQDGRFVASCGNLGRISLYAYIRGSAQADLPPKLLPLAVLNTGTHHTNSNMNNCVRFGTFAGQQRLIVTSQEHHIYFFALPAWPANGDEEALSEDGTQRITVAERELSRVKVKDLMVNDLRPWGEGAKPITTAAMADPATQHGQTGPRNPAQAAAAAAAAAAAPQHGQPGPSTPAGHAAATAAAATAAAAAHTTAAAAATAAGTGPYTGPGSNAASTPAVHMDVDVVLQRLCVVQEGSRHLADPMPLQTQGLFRFPKSTNCCEPSPDGRWLAVSLDAPYVVLVPSCANYWRRSPIIIKLPSIHTKIVSALMPMQNPMPYQISSEQQLHREPQQQQGKHKQGQRQQQSQRQQQGQHHEGKNQQQQQQQQPHQRPSDGPTHYYPVTESLYNYEGDLPAACQYCRFSPDGRYLAATSDALKALFVWRLPTCVEESSHGQADNKTGAPREHPSCTSLQGSPDPETEPRLFFVVRSRRTLLSLHWCPWDTNQLIVTEERRGLMMLDIRSPSASLRRAALPCCPSSLSPSAVHNGLLPPPRFPRINGLAMGAAGEVVLATPSVLFIAQAITHWSRALHALGHVASGLPNALYAAIRELLLGSQPPNLTPAAAQRHTPAAAQEYLPPAATAATGEVAKRKIAQPEQSAKKAASKRRGASKDGPQAAPAAAPSSSAVATSSTLTTGTSSSLSPVSAAAAAAAAIEKPSTPCLLHLLPPDVLELIISKAALPLWYWEPALPQPMPIKGTNQSTLPIRKPLGTSTPLESAHLYLTDDEINELIEGGWNEIGQMILQNKARAALEAGSDQPAQQQQRQQQQQQQQQQQHQQQQPSTSRAAPAPKPHSTSAAPHTPASHSEPSQPQADPGNMAQQHGAQGQGTSTQQPQQQQEQEQQQLGEQSVQLPPPHVLVAMHDPSWSPQSGQQQQQQQQPQSRQHRQQQEPQSGQQLRQQQPQSSQTGKEALPSLLEEGCCVPQAYVADPHSIPRHLLRIVYPHQMLYLGRVGRAPASSDEEGSDGFDDSDNSMSESSSSGFSSSSGPEDSN